MSHSYTQNNILPVSLFCLEPVISDFYQMIQRLLITSCCELSSAQSSILFLPDPLASFDLDDCTLLLEMDLEFDWRRAMCSSFFLQRCLFLNLLCSFCMSYLKLWVPSPQSLILSTLSLLACRWFHSVLWL